MNRKTLLPLFAADYIKRQGGDTAQQNHAAYIAKITYERGGSAGNALAIAKKSTQQLINQA